MLLNLELIQQSHEGREKCGIKCKVRMKVAYTDRDR